MTAPTRSTLKYMITLVLVRFIAIPLLAFSAGFSIINPLLALALILAVALGTSIAIRLVARLSRLSNVLYLAYLGILSGLGGLWISSVISTIQAIVIFVPVAVGYWIISWTRLGR